MSRTVVSSAVILLMCVIFLKVNTLFVYAAENDVIVTEPESIIAIPAESGVASVDPKQPVPKLTTEFVCFLESASDTEAGRDPAYVRSHCQDEHSEKRSSPDRPETLPAPLPPPLWTVTIPRQPATPGLQPMKPAPIRFARPVRSAPYPNTYAVVNGRLVCEKSNDHPSESDTHEKGHMDMECCLDPDEVPNPHCTYSSPIYAEMLKKFR
ncbi:MAG: hypothetical protein WCL23_05135 [Candidatus Moraniibacteriota bacterium]